MSMQAIHHNFASIRMNESFANHLKDNYSFKYIKQVFDLGLSPLIYIHVNEETYYEYMKKYDLQEEKTGFICYFYYLPVVCPWTVILCCLHYLYICQTFGNYCVPENQIGTKDIKLR